MRYSRVRKFARKKRQRSRPYKLVGMLMLIYLFGAVTSPTNALLNDVEPFNLAIQTSEEEMLKMLEELENQEKQEKLENKEQDLEEEPLTEEEETENGQQTEEDESKEDTQENGAPDGEGSEEQTADPVTDNEKTDGEQVTDEPKDEEQRTDEQADEDLKDDEQTDDALKDNEPVNEQRDEDGEEQPVEGQTPQGEHTGVDQLIEGHKTGQVTGEDQSNAENDQQAVDNHTQQDSDMD